MNKNFINFNKLNTIQDMLQWVANYFSSADIWFGHGADNPWDEALQLVIPSLHLVLNMPKNICTTQLTLNEKKLIISRAIRRVDERIPVAYITNKAWFCSHEFYIDNRVLIPRSPIGELINNRFSGLIQKKPKHILDMCTGSGCIAISCAYAFPESKVEAVDISIAALTVAAYNIKLHNLTQQITLIQSDLFINLPKIKYDLIVTNPPYVCIKNMFDLPNEYLHEPELGLISGIDGLKLIRSIMISAPDYLIEDGILICEVGDNIVDLTKKYPYIPFIWLEFDNGGHGVFMLDKEQLILARKQLTTI